MSQTLIPTTTSLSMNNGLLRLDILEYGVLHRRMRYKRTKDIAYSFKRKGKLPTEEEAIKEITELKRMILRKKIHFVVDLLYRSLKKSRKNEISRLKLLQKKRNDDNGETHKEKGDKKNNKKRKNKEEDLEGDLKILEECFYDENKESDNGVKKKDDKQSVLETLAFQKVNKLLEKIFNLRKEIPEYMPDWVKESIGDKDHKYNSSKFYRDANENVRKVLARLYNDKKVLEALKDADTSIRIVDGPVIKENNNSNLKNDGDDILENENNDSDSDHGELEDDDDDDINASEEGKEIFSNNEDYSQYDDLVIASEAESDDGTGYLSEGVDYNQVTDEEPSEDEDYDSNEEEDENSQEEDQEENSDNFFEGSDDKESGDNQKKEKSKKEKKEKARAVLPALQTGYFSGSESESDLEIGEKTDKVLQKLNTTKKNRRGQRARQKIWEKKYGKVANHVIKEQERLKSERERKQLEYEERVRKRAEKQRILEEKEKNNPNKVELGKRKTANDTTEKEMHPSWIAKRKAEEALAKLSFSGKKIKFD